MSVRNIGKIEAHQITTPRPVTVRLLADAFGLGGGDRDRFCAAVGCEPASRAATRPVLAPLAAEVAGQHDQVLAATRGGSPGSSAGVRDAGLVPRQLPAVTGHFVGRAAELGVLDRLAASSPDATAIVISVIAGMAGIGKTALAVHWAHRVTGRFPDGQLYVNLRGFDPAGTPMSPAEAIRGFLDALAVPPPQIPASVDVQAGLYRSLLAGRRVLVVLDNARDADQVRSLLPASPTCLVVVTSRNRLASLAAVEDAHLMMLDLLSAAEACQLLAQRLGQHRLAAEPQATDEIIARCARLPLALAIAAARAAAQPTFPLATLAAELREAQTRLDALAGEDAASDVRAVFSWSYHSLSPPAARLFRLLGLLPGPDIGAAAAASLARLPPPQVRPLLAELTCAHLLAEHTPGRYSLHDLLRTYAADQAHQIDTDEQRRAATRRALDHYLHTAHTAARLLNPTRDPITLPPPHPGATPEHLCDHAQAQSWFSAEHRVLLAAVDHAAGTALHTHTWQLAWTLLTFLNRRAEWHDLATTQRAALAAARRLADPTMQARAHRLLGHTYTRLGRFDDAHAHLRDSLDLATRAGDPIGRAHAHLTHAAVWERQGHHAQALDHAQEALQLYQAAGHRVGQARALNQIGWCQAHLGERWQALTACQHALALHQQLDNREGQASTWDSLGYAHHLLGQHTQAITCYQHALHLLRGLGDRYREADTLTRLGDTHHTIGNPDAARTAWHHALSILTDLEHPDSQHVKAKLHRVADTDVRNAETTTHHTGREQPEKGHTTTQHHRT